MTPLVLTLYGVLLAVAAIAVWRRPIVALYLFIVGLALHNLVLALLYDAGLRDGAIDAVQAWKEALLAVAVARVATDAVRERRLPFRPRVVDWLALAFAAVVCIYALIPQDVLDGEAGARAILYGLRHGLVPVVAYFLGRSLILDRVELRRIGWALLGAGAALAVGGLVDLYAVDVEWWRMPFPIQELVIPDALTGADVLAKAPTGSGKTFAFGVPACRARRSGGSNADSR